MLLKNIVLLNISDRVLLQYICGLRISPYLTRMGEITNQNNSEYGHFLQSGGHDILELYNHLGQV